MRSRSSGVSGRNRNRSAAVFSGIHLPLVHEAHLGRLPLHLGAEPHVLDELEQRIVVGQQAVVEALEIAAAVGERRPESAEEVLAFEHGHARAERRDAQGAREPEMPPPMIAAPRGMRSPDRDARTQSGRARMDEPDGRTGEACERPSPGKAPTESRTVCHRVAVTRHLIDPPFRLVASKGYRAPAAIC
jgi:hypothetical protein